MVEKKSFRVSFVDASTFEPRKEWTSFVLTWGGQADMLRGLNALPRASQGGFLPREAANQVTELLVQWRGGDRAALDALMPLVYAELRRLANHYLQRERSDHTLQSTALVHEAYVRLVGQDLPEWQNRAHFFGVAAQIMRQILVDYARTHKAAKRGGSVCKVTLEDAGDQPQAVDVDVVALDDALNVLAEMDPQQGRVVELKFFAGLSIEDTSEVLGISTSTVKRDWITARAWLFRELDRSSSA
jgi:RNA polymerase sigma factor (TIGR02999 family)